MTNSFLNIANLQQNASSKARDRAAERRLAKIVVKSDADAPMIASPLDKERLESQELLRRFNKAMRQRRQDLLKGAHGEEIKGLLQVLDSLTPISPPVLISYLVKCRWFVNADCSTRHDILWVIDTAIMTFRIRQGLSPFDDGLPGEPPTVLCIIRHHLTGAPLS